MFLKLILFQVFHSLANSTPKEKWPGTWRPVSSLCTSYKILSKCLSNHLKHHMDSIVNFNQSYCIPDCTIMDNMGDGGGGGG